MQSEISMIISVTFIVTKSASSKEWYLTYKMESPRKLHTVIKNRDRKKYSKYSFFSVLISLQKTHAYHWLQDDVPALVKQHCLDELISVFREEAAKVNMALIGSTQLVLVEGVSITENLRMFCLIFSNAYRVAWAQKNAEQILQNSFLIFYRKVKDLLRNFVVEMMEM